MSRPAAIALAALVAVCGLALASLTLPGAPGYDAWAWLIWGRELASGTLDTTAGASWKPLTSLIAAPLSLLGDSAPDAWLVIARIGWLGTVALGFEVARRIASESLELRAPAALGAGVLAAVGILLLSDAFTSWPRQALLGLSEPLLAALVLLAAERELAGRRTAAVLVAWLACLIRPEAWPFFLVYVAWAVLTPRRSGKRWRGIVAASGAVVALAGLWFIPDLVAAGDPLEGAIRARDASGLPVGEFFEAIGRGLGLAIPVLWLAAIAALFGEWRAGRDGEHPDRRVLRLGGLELGPAAILALLAAGWIGVVAAMAAGGYPGLPRFMAPAGAIGCVLGGAGIAWLIAERERWLRLAGAALLAGFVAFAIPRAAEYPADVDGARTVAGANRSLDRLTRPIVRLEGDCGRVVTTDFLYLTAIAWRLDVPPADVGVLRRPPQRRAALVASDVTTTSRERRGVGARLDSRDGRWSVYAIDCATGSRSSSSAGASGAGGRR